VHALTRGALTTGANDVANSFSTAVASKTLTHRQAIVVFVLFMHCFFVVVKCYILYIIYYILCIIYYILYIMYYILYIIYRILQAGHYSGALCRVRGSNGPGLKRHRHGAQEDPRRQKI
jgi:hypothetical protein